MKNKEITRTLINEGIEECTKSTEDLHIFLFDTPLGKEFCESLITRMLNPGDSVGTPFSMLCTSSAEAKHIFRLLNGDKFTLCLQAHLSVLVVLSVSNNRITASVLTVTP
jgi:hypothetical protein